MSRYIFLFFLLLSFHSYAQLNKGQWLAGGSISFSYHSAYGEKLYSLQAFPAAGYFFADRFATGLRTNLSTTTDKWADGKERELSLFLAPFFRFYCLPPERKINLLADASYGWGWASYRNFSGADSYNTHHGQFNFMAGPAFILNPHTSLELTLGYQRGLGASTDSLLNNANSFRFNIGFQVHLGRRKD